MADKCWNHRLLLGDEIIGLGSEDEASMIQYDMV